MAVGKQVPWCWVIGGKGEKQEADAVCEGWWSDSLQGQQEHGTVTNQKSRLRWYQEWKWVENLWMFIFIQVSGDLQGQMVELRNVHGVSVLNWDRHDTAVSHGHWGLLPAHLALWMLENEIY